MKIQEIPRKSKVLGPPQIFLKFLESARFVEFSDKSLVVLVVMNILEYSSGQYRQVIPRKSKMLEFPWIFRNI